MVPHAKGMGRMVTGLTTSAKRAVGRAMNRLGYVVFRTPNLSTYPLSKHLADLFQLYRIDCVFDVGGNEGEYGTLLRDRVGYGGPIVSVEPVGSHAEALRAAAAGDRNWMVRQVALGAQPGRLAMNVTRHGVFSSFLTPDTSRVEQYATENEVVRTEEVEVTTFDALLASVRDEGLAARSVYLKLDTQGYDLEVLKGAGRSLSAVRGLQTEMSVQPIYHGMPDYRTALDRVEALGFVLSGMFPVNLDPRMRLIEFDCVLVRRDAGGG
jgi:FkbM family methyltransferase